nr:monovalent cation/H(+) antiporter subunit G [Flexivirga oryzae]
MCVVGCAFEITGVVGVLRMPDFYLRVQCCTLVGTLGLVPFLVALVVAEGPVTPYGGRALIVGFLALLLGPAAGHALARSAHRIGIPVHPGAAAHDELDASTPDEE